eukprot:5364130-Alexandrium_andersonii.AAC.1
MRARVRGAKRRSAQSLCTPRPGTAAIHKGACRRRSGHGRSPRGGKAGEGGAEKKGKPEGRGDGELSLIHI